MKFVWSMMLLALFPIYLLGIDFVPNQVIFKTNVPTEITRGKTGLDSFDSFLAENNINTIKPVLNKSQNRFFVATFQQDIDWNVIENLHFNGIEYMQPNYINEMHLIPNDELFPDQQSNLENCYIPDAWNLSTGNEQILVAIIDSGLHFDHPDLQDNIYINENEIPDDGIDNDNNGYIDDWRGWDFVDAPELSTIGLGDFIGQDNDPTDELNHGTHIAGIIGADTNNDTGISGICWNTKMLIIRSGFSTNIAGSGYLQDDDAAAGIIYAADMGANVINISWGDVNYSQIIADACNYAFQMGSIIIASAGNEGATPEHVITYPAKLSTTIAVGAVTNTSELASFSSWGEQIDLVAPGNIILSTYSPDELYKTMSGTSMAAPFVVGAVALILSNEPEMDFGQIRGRLISSTTDLGTIGFDFVFGHGLLNVYNLLVDQTYPQIVIDTPYDYQGMNSSFDIIGTVTSDNFWRYSVEYAAEDSPGYNWFDVDPDIHFYTDPVINDVIAQFDFNENFDEGYYKIKIELSNPNQQENYSYYRTVYIDQTPADFYPEYAVSMKRYAGDLNEYYLQAVFNDEVNIQSYDPENPLYYPSVVADSIQIIKVNTENCETGTNIIDITATNLSNLETIVENAYELEIEQSSISEHGLTSEIFGDEVVSVRKTYDFDGNGINEFLNLNTTENEWVLKIMEPTPSGVVTKHIIPTTSFWPHDIGNTNDSGMEIIGISGDNVNLFDTVNSNYPDQFFILAGDTYGASFIDYDGDGLDEVALVKNDSINGSNKRVLALWNRSGDLFSEEYVILNNSPTSEWNVFTNKVICGLLDNDTFPDIVASDKDGDIMVFEQLGNSFIQTWATRLPVPNAFYLAEGDFTGDGSTEFCVGGYSINYSDPNKTFSYFAFFKNTGEDNQYGQIGYVSFTQVDSKNSISSIDIDGNGDMELYISTPPNAYIVDFQNGEFVPIWKGSSSNTSQHIIAVSSKTATDDAYIITNVQDGNERKGAIFRNDVAFNGPPTPEYFTAKPLNENSAKLDWHAEERPHFNVYRKKNEVIQLIAENINESEYLDETLSLGDTVYYRVTAVDTIFTPEESLPTSWRQVIPNVVPQVTNIKMISTYQVQIDFDHKLHNSAANRAYFRLEPEIGLPSNVNLIHENKTTILNFPQQLEPVDVYSITFSDDLVGETGVPVGSGSYEFYYEADTISPRILRAYCEDNNIVNVVFSESLVLESAEEILNYSLGLPAADKQNEIAEINYFDADSSYVRITFKTDLVYTNQSYFLQILNVEDLAGNVITGSGNKCHFSLTGNSGPRNLNQLKVYPNPLNMSESEFGVINFINLPLNKRGKLSIFDLSGELIFEKEFGPFVSSIENVNWDCRNLAGKRISSGMYYYLISMGKDLKQGKIVIIN